MTNFKFVALVACFMALLSFQTHQQKKVYKVEAPLEYWIQVSNGMEFTKNSLKTSDLPAKTVTMINDSLFTPFQEEIARQVKSQIALEEKKKDTSKPKKK